MPAIWQKLEAHGLLTTEACGDTPRVILGSPVAGIAADELIDPQPAIDAILDRYIGSKEFSNLPRKFKTAISWQQDVAHEVNDVSFIGVEHPEHGPGFDVWVGGGLSTNPKIAPAARRLGAAGRGPRRLGRHHRRSSATTATGGCGTGPGSSSWSPTGAPRSSAGCSRRSTCTAR